MLEEIGKYDELIDNLFEDRLKRFDLDEKIRGYKKRKVNVGKNGKSKIESDTFSYDFDLIERRENLFLTVIPNLKKEINDVFEDDDERVIEIKDDLDKLEEKIRDLVLENDGVETNE